MAAVIDDDETVEAATTKEEKNAFAMRVLRRIRTKLEGREPGENLRLIFFQLGNPVQLG